MLMLFLGNIFKELNWAICIQLGYMYSIGLYVLNSAIGFQLGYMYSIGLYVLNSAIGFLSGRPS